MPLDSAVRNAFTRVHPFGGRTDPFGVLTVALTLLVVGAPHAARAGGELTVKARAQLTDLETVARGARIEVAGTLRDNLGQPVARERLEVRLDDAPPETAASDRDGRFRVRVVGGAEGIHTVRVRFPGSALLGPAEAAGQVTVGRTAVTLLFTAPSEIEFGTPIEIDVRATEPRGAPQPGLVVRLRIDETELSPTTTDADGRSRWSLLPLPRGRHRLLAVSAADDEHLGASATHDVMVWAPLTVTLDPLPEHLAAGDALDVAGRLSGAPGESVPIVLTANGQPIGGTSTTAAGEWRIIAPARALTAGRLEIRAMASPASPDLRAAFSERRFIEVAAPPPRSLVWVLAPVVLGGFAAGLAAWRRRAPDVSRPPTAEPAGVTAPAAFVRAAGASPEGDLTVEVRDAVTAMPIAGAACHLLDGPPGTLPPAASTTPDGRARLSGVGQRLRVEASGYAPAMHPCPVPPGGHVVVRLLTPRARIQACHEEVLRAAGRPVLRFGRETPAQSARALVDRGAPPGLVEAFTAAVEHGCFGREAPGPDTLLEVEVTAAALRTHFGERTSARSASRPGGAQA